MFRKLLLITPFLTANVLANTIEFTAHNPAVKCDLIRNDLSPAYSKYDDGIARGVLIGYNAKGKIPVARTLIIDNSQNTDIIISNSPRLTETGSGCLFKFIATSPAGYDFYKPSFDDLVRPTAKFTSAQLLPSD